MKKGVINLKGGKERCMGELEGEDGNDVMCDNHNTSTSISLV